MAKEKFAFGVSDAVPRIINNLSMGFDKIERQGGGVVDLVTMNAHTYRMFMYSFGRVIGFDSVTRKELLSTGYVGDFWGARVYIDNDLADDIITLECIDDKKEE